jgi:hypothetical protein
MDPEKTFTIEREMEREEDRRKHIQSIRASQKFKNIFTGKKVVFVYVQCAPHMKKHGFCIKPRIFVTNENIFIRDLCAYVKDRLNKTCTTQNLYLSKRNFSHVDRDLTIEQFAQSNTDEDGFVKLWLCHWELQDSFCRIA